MMCNHNNIGRALLPAVIRYILMVSPSGMCFRVPVPNKRGGHVVAVPVAAETAETATLSSRPPCELKMVFSGVQSLFCTVYRCDMASVS
jgi:hypothetical protein